MSGPRAHQVDHDVVVVGAGPSGLLLAAELSRARIDVAVLERRADSAPGTRAIGVHPPTLLALEASGAAEQILARAARIPRGIARTRDRQLGEVRFDRTGARFPFVAAVPQAVTEAAVGAGAPDPLRGVLVGSLRDAGDFVVLTTDSAAGPGELRARAVVVAAGASGRALVAASHGVCAREFPDRYLMADIKAAPTQPETTAVITLDGTGVLESFPLPGGGRRLVAWVGRGGEVVEPPGERADELLRRAVATRTGDEALAAGVARAQGFGIRRVLLGRMRRGRVFAIGDTAHEVSPIGGQGMNLGLLDAATLASALVRWLRDDEATSELDRWERRRLASARTAARLAGANTSVGRSRPVAAHLLATTALRVALSGPLARLAANAYAMGLDADATPSGRQ